MSGPWEKYSEPAKSDGGDVWKGLRVSADTQLERDRQALRLVVDELAADPTNPNLRRDAAELMKKVGGVGPAAAFPPEDPRVSAMSGEEPKQIPESGPWERYKPVAEPAAQQQREQQPRPAEFSGENFRRQLGLKLREGLEGGTMLPNAVLSGVGGIYNVLTPNTWPRVPEQAAVFSNTLTRLGLPVAETPTERVTGEIAKSLSGTGGMIGAVRRAPAMVRALADAPGIQALSSVLGPGGAQAATEAGASPVVAGAAGIVGSVAPGLRTTQGGTARAQANVRDFDQAGAQITAGQATESTFFRALENLISKVPGGQGIMKRFAQQQQEDLGRNAQTGVSAEEAGRAVEAGVRGARGQGGFLQRTRATWQQLDNDLAAQIPRTTRIVPGETIATLDGMVTPSFGAEATTGGLVNPQLAAMRANIATDLANNQGAMPYHALRELRSRVGEQIDNAMVSGIGQGQLRQVYAALTRDLEEAANQAGAGAEFRRQNNYYRARMDRIDTTLDRVIGRDRQPEDIFKILMPKDRDEANRIRQVMRSLQPGEREVVSAAIINRLGRAKPGVQDELGDIFSTETFLTNWNKLGPGAKSQIFEDAQMRSDMEAIARAAANIREGGSVMKNPSGTMGALAGYGAGLGFLSTITTGSLGPAALATTAILGANLTGRLLTYQPFVRWLAQGTRLTSADRQAAHFARLAEIFNGAPDDVKQDLAEAMPKQ